MNAVLSIYEGLKSRMEGQLSDAVLKEKAEIAEEIFRLKKEKNAVILVHNYIDPVLFHAAADITGDSLDLSRRACGVSADIILVCGVSFMAETVKLLNPGKKVLCPVEHAGCSLAESVTSEDVRAARKKFPDAAIAAYINTYADVKAEIDICCTSGNAERVLRSLEPARVVFLPDENLASNVAASLDKSFGSFDAGGGGKEPEVIIWDGRCEVHERFTPGDVEAVRRAHPEALILAHPECPPAVAEAADFTGGTAAMIRRIEESGAEEFCLFTESAMEKNIALDGSTKTFIEAPSFRCPHMEKISLENTLLALREERYEIGIPRGIRDRAAESVRRMLAVSEG